MTDNNRPRTKPVDGPKGNEEWDLRIIRGGDGKIISDRRKGSNQ
jgi:hypothetical protein